MRVRASISKPRYDWGYVDHTSIGPVHSLEDPDEVIVDFPEQHGWRGLISELEVVVDDSEGEACTVEKPLKQISLTIFRKNNNDHPQPRRWVSFR